MPSKKRVFRIEQNTNDPGGVPLILIDDTDTVVRTGDRAGVLADIAFDTLGADEVWHGYLLLRAAQ
jgi:hypothetical protein